MKKDKRFLQLIMWRFIKEQSFHTKPIEEISSNSLGDGS